MSERNDNDEAAKLLADPLAYTDEQQLHAALTHLRATAPVCSGWTSRIIGRSGRSPSTPTCTMDIERENMLFTNWPRPVLTTAEGDEMQAAAGVRTLIHLGRSATPGGARDRLRLVSPKGNAGVEG